MSRAILPPNGRSAARSGRGPIWERSARRALALLAGLLTLLLVQLTAAAPAPAPGAPPPAPAGQPGPAAGQPAEEPGSPYDEEAPPGAAAGSEPGPTAAGTAATPAGPPGSAPTAAPASGRSLPPLSPTEAELAKGQRIGEVRIIGNQRVSRQEIRSYLKSMRVGKLFEPTGVSADVRELWDTGSFEDVEVDLSRRDENVALRIVVRERPNIRELTFTGNKELDKEDLEKAIASEVKVGNIINHAAVRRAIQAMRDKYAEEGFFLAEARYEVLPEKDNQVTVKFTIKEHEKVTVRRITFIGNHNIPDDELRELMVIGKPSFFDIWTGGPFRQDAFERDVLILSSLYYDRGFLTVQVSAPRVMLTPDRSGIELVITVDEGPRFRIRRLQLAETDEDGREVEPLGGRRNLREMVRARPGDYFNRAELVKDLSTIQTMYRDAGYANVEAPPQTQLFADEELVDIIIKIRRRQMVYFGRIEISGNTKTRDKVIRREMEIAEGEHFSETNLEASRRRIAQLGYFERVDVSSEAGADPSRLNVSVDVVEKPTGTFQIGAGFSSIESFIATAQVQQANLFGRGQSLSLMAQLSGLRQLIDIRFFEPYFLDSPFDFSIDLFDQYRLYSEFGLNSLGGSLTFGYPLINPELRTSLTYTLKNDEVDTRGTSTFLGTASAVSVFQRLPLANLFQDGITSSLRPAITYDSRDNRLFPTEGVYLQYSFEPALGVFGSDNEFLKHRLIGRFYYPITRNIVFKVNAEAGLVTSPQTDCSDGESTCGVPLFARFFLGGIFDVRGYRLRTIGPRLPLRDSLDENAPQYTYGANIGGNLLYFQNIEIEFPILDEVGLRGVVFTDLGNTWNTEGVYCSATAAAPHAVTNPCFDAESLTSVRTSWGFGIRWFSPLGPLRFEWGFPFKTLPYEESSVFEFTIGNFF